MKYWELTQNNEELLDRLEYFATMSNILQNYNNIGFVNLAPKDKVHLGRDTKSQEKSVFHR
ncbi:hypothetical protein MIDIC_230109 [Alphaproteobacteria bacterium]